MEKPGLSVRIPPLLACDNQRCDHLPSQRHLNQERFCAGGLRLRRAADAREESPMDPNWLVPITLFVCVIIAFAFTSIAFLELRNEQKASGESKQ